MPKTGTKKQTGRLTPKQEKFVRLLIEGKSQRQAYRESYSAARMKDHVIDTKASDLLKKPHIAERYEQLKEKAASESVATREELLQFWTQLVRKGGNGVELQHSLKGSELLGKFYGMFKDRIDVEQNRPFEVTIETIESIGEGTENDDKTDGTV